MTSLYAASQYSEDLDEFVAAGAVQSRDLRAVAALLHVASATSDVDRLAWVAFALVLGTPRSGHTCVDFLNISLWKPENINETLVRWPADHEEWIAAVRKCEELVCSPENRSDLPRRPFVLSGTRLYAARSFDEEVRVAAYLRQAIDAGRIEIITGGPGSGKTTYIADKIIEHVSNRSGSDTIALAAPTGLAAKRMARALRAAVRTGINDGKISPEMEKIVDGLPKVTIHKLLKFNPVARVQWRFNKHDTMPYDYVIIDEVSMMPLSMMARVLEAMKKDARLMLVGDPYQLASVEAGTVLADIVEASSRGTGFVTVKTGSYRFLPGSPVADISTHIKLGIFEAAREALKLHHTDPEVKGPFSWVDPVTNDKALQVVARIVAEHARKLCVDAAKATSDQDYRELIKFRDSLQVVCAHRRGNLGVSGWNSAVERQLGALAHGQWYLGRPVMVTKNDSASGLANGDIGVVCKDSKGSRVVVFGDAEEVRLIPISSVPHVETVHALTIHKSQGSEFAHTIVVLPKGKSRILTRELLYTGITRAKPRLTLIATETALEFAITTKVQRATGLADLL